MIKKVEIFKDFRKSLGLVLVFVGMQFNTAIKNIVLGVDLSVVIMLLSALLLLDLKSIFRLRMSRPMRIIMAFQLTLLFFSVISDRSTTQLLSFHLYLVALIFVLSTNKEYLQFSYFGKILFWVSGFIAVLVLFQATDKFTRLVLSYENTGKLWLSQGGDPITMSRAIEFNFIACLFFKEKNKVEKTAAWLFVFADIIGMFSFGNRSVIICSTVVFLIWYGKYFNRKIDIKKLAITIIVIVAIVYLGSKTTYISDRINTTYNSIVNGLGTLLNFNTSVVDPSAKTRVTILANMWKEFNNNFVRNFLIGLGYNYTYVDRPIYQIFFDLGIIALVLYAYFLIFIPLKTIIKQLKYNNEYNSAWIFVVYSSIQVIADQLLTGLPYYYHLWTPTIFFLFSLNNFKLKKI